jgi:hypothetical protein
MPPLGLVLVNPQYAVLQGNCRTAPQMRGISPSLGGRTRATSQERYVEATGLPRLGSVLPLSANLRHGGKLGMKRAHFAGESSTPHHYQQLWMSCPDRGESSRFPGDENVDKSPWLKGSWGTYGSRKNPLFAGFDERQRVWWLGRNGLTVPDGFAHAATLLVQLDDGDLVLGRDLRGVVLDEPKDDPFPGGGGYYRTFGEFVLRIP